MYTKGTGETTPIADTPLPRPQSSMSSASSAEETGRLKSVVQVVTTQPPLSETVRCKN